MRKHLFWILLLLSATVFGQNLQVQSRSADEPMTTRVICLTCGNQWSED